ncbi:phosphomannomutase [Sphaerisporangium krabiense]|uniref:Phosphomannomutase n=1 Tax=Sphaerisporangium krabiense TaxID=763782 RepID=A0A7W8YZP6_9ACTN|nr:phospho-sugar mutase [Sphaerisporangium krabiense]MBB5624769.1 phosphomannomutase [Sphaerisporangium krabiense]GII61271.1 phosphomannomutase [Sphaerisporangium krabiense]
MTDLVRRAEEWLAQDPDPETREELRRVLDDGDTAALQDRFGAKLEFGTAGLRGELGAGPNRMNRVTVMRAAAGLAARLGPGRHVVIGHDARHNSDVFARDSAAVLTGAGLRVSLMDDHQPTPVLAFAVRHLGADAGIMVTASHNPPRDNGYKVYWGDGSQIVPPLDEEISAAIDAVGPVGALPLGGAWETLSDAAITEPYLAAVTALPLGEARDLRVAYTPMHGVGGELLLRAFAAAGFAAPSVVEAQFTPDPDFPTVAFPNPEEPGAMDLALELAAKTGADLVIANDPDADRCAVGVPLPGGGYRMLTGDEVGGLLGEYVITRTSGPGRLVAASIVSSSLLGKIAEAHGVRHAETLTGFKWIVKAGDGLVYGYEEALGYTVGGDGGLPVRDKDGVGAALMIAALAAGARRDGLTLLDLLDRQARAYGLHATAQLSVRVDDLSLIAGAMARLRSAPPAKLGDHVVVSAEDLAAGVDGLPPTDGLRYRLSGGARVVIRPSGTEPKLKCYLEVVLPAGNAGAPGGAVADARARAEDALSSLRAAVAATLAL